MYKYNKDYLPWIILHLVLYALILGSLEYFHRKAAKKEVNFPKSAKKIISTEQFEAELVKGRNLVLLDDMVLDIDSYMYQHPGGKFVLERNVGRDISKFFYGAFVFENTGGRRPHLHSNFARKAVHSLIIGHLWQKAKTTKGNICEKQKVNDDIAVFIFKTGKSIF